MNYRSPDAGRTHPLSSLASKLVRVALLALLLTAAVSAARLALPGGVFACSCAAPPNGAPMFDGEEDAVLVGRVGVDDGSGVFSFAVERWFKGGEAGFVRLASDTQRLPDGSFVTNTCGVSLDPGSRLVLVAWRSEGVLTPSACSPHANVETAEGQAMLAAAVRTFGPGSIPGAGPPADPAEPTDPPATPPLVATDLALPVVLLGVLLIVGVLFGVVALIARRGRAPG